MAYTPGPWHIVPMSSLCSHAPKYYVARPHGLDGDYGSVAPEIAANYHQIASMCSEDNARLIVAAPKLLEALKYVMSAHGEQLHDAFDMAHKAIAEAEGR